MLFCDCKLNRHWSWIWNLMEIFFCLNCGVTAAPTAVLKWTQSLFPAVRKQFFLPIVFFLSFQQLFHIKVARKSLNDCLSSIENTYFFSALFSSLPLFVHKWKQKPEQEIIMRIHYIYTRLQSIWIEKPKNVAAWRGNRTGKYLIYLYIYIKLHSFSECRKMWNVFKCMKYNRATGCTKASISENTSVLNYLCPYTFSMYVCKMHSFLLLIFFMCFSFVSLS